MNLLNLFKNTGKEIIKGNKEATKEALKAEAGKTVVKTSLKAVKKQLPFYARGYVDHPFAEIVTSLVLSIAVDFVTKVDEENPVYISNKSARKKLEVLGDGLRLNTANTTIGNLGIAETITELIDGVDLSAIMGTDYSKMKIEELKDECEKQGIEIPKGVKTKKALIKLLEE